MRLPLLLGLVAAVAACGGGGASDPAPAEGGAPSGEARAAGSEAPAHPPGEGPPSDGDHAHAHDAHDGAAHADGAHGGAAHEHGHTPGAHDGAGMTHSFADTQRFAAIFDAPGRDAWQKPDEVVRALAVAPGHTVVDLGAGTGYFLARLARAVGPRGRVLALDAEPAMVEHVRRRAADEGLTRVEARVVQGDDPGLEAASVDRVLIVDTWHHLPERARYAAALRRALRPRGEVLVVDFDLDAARGPSREHKLAPDVVVRELEAGGFEQVAILEETLPDQYLVRARR